MIEALKNIGFVVTERLERKELSSDLQNRYSELPADYQEFLQRFQTITNESDNVWFNSIEDFNGESDSGFRWNEFVSGPLFSSIMEYSTLLCTGFRPSLTSGRAREAITLMA